MPVNTEAILLVDDEYDDRSTISTMLRQEGFTVLEAASYRQAAGIFDRQRQEIDLLLTDVSLPGENGCELAKALLRLKPDLKVLFVSGHTGAEVCRFYGIATSDKHFLRMPFSKATLMQAVQRVIVSTESSPGFLEALKRENDWENGGAKRPE